MKHIVIFLALLIASQARAQDSAVVVPVGSANDVPVAASAQSNVQGNGNTPIVIINKNKVSGTQDARAAVQDQPISVVQDAPLKASAADNMRKNRMESEAVTEDGIVQALERARMQDEIKRRDRFNNAIAPSQTDTTVVSQNGNGNTATVVTAQQQPVVAQQLAQPAVVAQPAIVAPVAQPVVAQPIIAPPIAEPIQKIHVVEDEESVTTDYKDDRRDDRDHHDVHEEVRANLEEPKKKDEDRERYYVAALASFGQYNNSYEVDRSLGYGVSVGTVLPQRFVIEGSFFYGSYELPGLYLGSCGYGSCAAITPDMRQYNVEAAVKYQILGGRFRPVVGAVLGYTRRNYQLGGQDFLTSDAADVGALVGADLALTESFALGIDFRYMTNLGYRQNLSTGEIVYQQASDIERMDYYTLNLLAKFMF